MSARCIYRRGIYRRAVLIRLGAERGFLEDRLDCVQVVTQRSKGWITVEDDDDGYQHAYKLPRDQVKRKYYEYRAPTDTARRPTDTARRWIPRAEQHRAHMNAVPRACRCRARGNAARL